MNTNLYQITIGQLVIDVVKKDIKNIHLGVYPPDGNIRIATPLKVNDDRVRLFAISKLPWIKKQQAKFQAQSRQSPREFVSGESHYFQGRRYLLNVIYHKSSPKVIIKNNTNIHLFVRENSTLEQRKKVMTEWYRQQLKEQIPTLLDKWQSITGLTANDWGIKQMKTKWGSCNITDKRIWLNLELAKKPQICLEYVIVHELVHLLERNHNERFIAYMDKFMPQWPIYKEELSQFIL
jgi:predicted metal-dependent hydrolase